MNYKNWKTDVLRRTSNWFPMKLSLYATLACCSNNNNRHRLQCGSTCIFVFVAHRTPYKHTLISDRAFNIGLGLLGPDRYTYIRSAVIDSYGMNAWMLACQLCFVHEEEHGYLLSINSKEKIFVSPAMRTCQFLVSRDCNRISLCQRLRTWQFFDHEYNSFWFMKPKSDYLSTKANMEVSVYKWRLSTV